MNHNIKIFHLSTSVRIFNGVFKIFIVMTFMLLVAGAIKEPASICFLSFFIIPSVFVMFYLNLFQPIAITETHLRLYTFWGTYKDVPWEHIIDIHRPKLTGFPSFFRRDGTLIVKGKNIGLFYKFYGLIYDEGGEGFLISPHIVQNKEFFSELQKYYPKVSG